MEIPKSEDNNYGKRTERFDQTHTDNYSQWYNDLVFKADLAEQSAVRGVHGYQALWLCNMGKNAASARPDVQGDRCSECLFPSAYS